MLRKNDKTKAMKNFKPLIILISIFLLAGCGASVKTINPDNTDLSQYKTFAYLPNTNAEVPGKTYNDDKVNAMIIETINSNMQDAGYTLDRENPDLLVLVSTKTDLETETSTQPAYVRYPYRARMTAVRPYYNSYYYTGYNSYAGIVGYNTDTYSYKEGTVIIDIVDRKTKNTVWKGTSTEDIFNQNENSAIAELVNAIFDKYPLVK